MVTELIERAWREERERYQIYGPGPYYLWERKYLATYGKTELLRGTKEACQAHLDRLCAQAVEKALAAAGLAIVPVEPTEAMLVAGFKTRTEFGEAEFIEGYEAEIYRAMLTAALNAFPQQQEFPQPEAGIPARRGECSEQR